MKKNFSKSYIIHQIHKAWSEHGVEALWTGQKNILLSCPKMPRLHARSRLYDLGVFNRPRPHYAS